MRCAALAALLSGPALVWHSAAALNVRSLSGSADRSSSDRAGTLLVDLDKLDLYSAAEKTEVILDVVPVDGPEEDGPGDGAKVNFSPEKRKEAHDAKYIADFWVELNMTWANELGLPLGAALKADENWIPTSFDSVRKYGLLEEWNKKNPDKQVIVGDQIVQVNDVQFHANSRTFLEHIVGQFKSGRQLRDGASKVLKLHILRERPFAGPYRSAYQRLNKHQKDYPKEFTARLPMPNITGAANPDHAIGWKLNYWQGHNWQEPWIEDIHSKGMIAKWNKAHPDQLILEGDEVIMVGNKHWHRSRKDFHDDVQAMFHKCRQRGNESLELYIRRPRYIQEIYDMLPKREHVTEETKVIHASITLSQGGGSMPQLLGWQIANVTSDKDPVRIHKIRGQGSLGQWNARNADHEILPNDQIVRVNNAKWHGNSILFAQNLNKQVLASRGGQLELLVNRPVREVTPLSSIVPGSRLKVFLQVNVTLAMPLPENDLGLKLTSVNLKSPVTIQAIDERGLAARWNSQNPDQKIEVGDMLIAMNGIPWRNDPVPFKKLVLHQYEAAVLWGYQNGTCKLTFQKVDHMQQQAAAAAAAADALASQASSAPTKIPSPEESAHTGTSDLQTKDDSKSDDDEGWVGAED